MEDFTKALTYEIKQDIANRYFGFRKRIETDSSQYLLNLQSGAEKFTAGITSTMQRMHCLLQDERLFRSFINFTKLPEEIGCFYTDPQSAPQWRLLFIELKGEGLTRRRRYRNLVFKVYNLLNRDISGYRETFLHLEEEHEEICNEIKRFYRMNDLSGILSFLREIDNPDAMKSGLLPADNSIFAGQNIDQELRILPPPGVSSKMHLLDPLSPLQEAKPTLEALIKKAFPLFTHLNIGKLPF